MMKITTMWCECVICLVSSPAHIKAKDPTINLLGCIIGVHFSLWTILNIFFYIYSNLGASESEIC